MTCPRCGFEVADGQKFCTECGAPMPDPSLYEGYQDSEPQNAPAPGAPQQPKKKPKVWLIVLIIVLVILACIITAAALFVHSMKKQVEKYQQKLVEEDQLRSEMDAGDIDANAGDIDMDALNEAVEAMKDLDLNTDIDVDFKDPEVPEVPDDLDPTADANGNVTHYGYADVIRDGNDITVIPNGKLDGSTKLFNEKDLEGFLDYVDSTVLEKGRKINRDMFYDVLSTLLVDKDLIVGKENISSNMMLALAVSNNFHDIDVRITEGEIDPENPAKYRYHVKTSGRDDIWLIDYSDRTVFFNDGKTEYHSDMFKDEYLAIWLVAIDEYYGF